MISIKASVPSWLGCCLILQEEIKCEATESLNYSKVCSEAESRAGLLTANSYFITVLGKVKICDDSDYRTLC